MTTLDWYKYKWMISLETIQAELQQQAPVDRHISQV